jgi:glycerophosphoryl diester phosphodiesterase
MQIIGHRGAAGLAPENTRASIKAALIAGVDGIEFDVRSTRDGRVVLMHDRHTMRVSNKPHFISRTMYAALKKVRLRYGNTIPTLAEALNTIDGQANVLIEIKSRGCAKTVVRHIEHLVKKGAKYDDFMVGSFRPKYLREVQWLNNQVPLALFMFHRPFRFMRIKGLHLRCVGFYHRFMPHRAIKEAHLHGLSVYAYTVNSPRRARQLQERGVQGLATNRPDLLQEFREKKENEKE